MESEYPLFALIRPLPFWTRQILRIIGRLHLPVEQPHVGPRITVYLPMLRIHPDRMALEPTHGAQRVALEGVLVEDGLLVPPRELEDLRLALSASAAL